MGKPISLLPDLLLTLSIFLLLSLSILIIYSSDINLAIQQLLFALVGLIFYFVLSFIDFENTSVPTFMLYGIIILLLLVVWVLGVETRGSSRWIPLGPIQFQPSEFAKPVLILLLAKFWMNRAPDWRNIFLSFLLFIPIFLLVFRQPDLGTALTILAIWFFTLIGANLSLKKIGLMTIAAGVVMPISWNFMKDYQRQRITSFLSPNEDPLGVGYNVIQSTIAVGSGGLMGRGLGRGTQSRLQFLPEFRTDFIFASIAEELGFIGSCIVLLLYGTLLGRCLRIIATITSRFGIVLVMGVVGMLFFQIMVNIGMNIAVVPVTGITLPLLSYGGSSVVSTLICLGLVASVSKFHTRTKYFQET